MLTRPRLRSHNSYTDRTLELLNRLWNYLDDPFQLLVEISLSVTHPWNAIFLDKNLIRRKQPDRDSFWTNWVNAQTTDDDNCITILIEWSLYGQTQHTNREHQFLAAIVLSWLFTSSNRPIRDNATKALANLMRKNSQIFSKLLEHFSSIDDPYVLERILAAAYGSCCNTPDPNRLKEYSDVVFREIFYNESPPYGLLLRDYAFGIIELAAYYKSLSPNVDLEYCQPPYKSPRPYLTVSEERLRKISEAAGDNKIVYSSSMDFGGDFSRYVIEPRIRDFVRVGLHTRAPLTVTQAESRFESQVVRNDSERSEAYEQLHEIVRSLKHIELLSQLSMESTQPTNSLADSDQHSDVVEAEKRFVLLLDKDEKKRFKKEAKPYLYKDRQLNRDENMFDVGSLKRWVAKRAYSFGWTLARFPHDQSLRGNYSRDRSIVERVGKKYQWLALDELLCRLADNYWIRDRYGSSLPYKYSSPLELGFVRDIDPSIISEKFRKELDKGLAYNWAFNPQIIIDEVKESEMPSWPHRSNPAQDLESLQIRTDSEGVKWLVVYEDQVKIDKYPEENSKEHSYRLQEFRFLHAIFVKTSELTCISKHFCNEKSINSRDVRPPQMTDTGYLFEATWRNTWDQEVWSNDNLGFPPEASIADIVINYIWEPHLDASMPEGFSCYIPSPWLIRQFQLQSSVDKPYLWLDSAGKIAFEEVSIEKYGTICLLRLDIVERLARDNDMVPFSFFLAERNAWPGGRNDLATWRRTEGICWKENGNFVSRHWNQDKCGN